MTDKETKTRQLEMARDNAEESAEAVERLARMTLNSAHDDNARAEANAAARYYGECRAIADKAPFVYEDDPAICRYYYRDTQLAAERARVAAQDARRWADDPARRATDQARADGEIVAATAAFLAARRAYRAVSGYNTPEEIPAMRALHDSEARARAAYTAAGIVPPTLLNE